MLSIADEENGQVAAAIYKRGVHNGNGWAKVEEVAKVLEKEPSDLLPTVQAMKQNGLVNVGNPGTFAAGMVSLTSSGNALARQSLRPPNIPPTMGDEPGNLV